MLIFYADEFGDHSMLTSESDHRALKPGTSRFFILAGIGVRDTSRKPLAEGLLDIKRKHFGATAVAGPWGETEIKGRHLARAARSAATGRTGWCPRGYRELTTPRQVSALLKDLGLVLSTFRPLVFAVAIDKAEMVTRHKDLHPVPIAYTYMHQRIATAMEKLYAGDAAIIVADQQSQHEKIFRAGGMKATRDVLSRNLPRKPNYDLVLDKPLWVDTELSTWDREIIQLADMVAYSVGTCMTRGETPAEPYYLWDQIRMCLAAHYTTGHVLGGGLSIFPKEAKAPKGL